MATYTVRVERSGRYWALHIVELDGWTQARHLREVEYMARDWIHGMTDEALDSFDLDIEIAIPEKVQQHLDREKALREASSQIAAEAAAESRAAAKVLHDKGVTLRDIGVLLGVSHQRAHQLVQAAKAEPQPRPSVELMETLKASVQAATGRPQVTKLDSGERQSTGSKVGAAH